MKRIFVFAASATWLFACNSTPQSETPEPSPTVTTPATTEAQATATPTATETATPAPTATEEAPTAECGCASDDDCVKLSPGCCSCSAGGTEIAVAKKCQDQVEKCDKKGVMCPQVYKCTDAKAACVSGECQLTAGTGAAPKTDIK